LPPADVTCAVCDSPRCQHVHTFRVEQAANHLISPLRSPDRNALLAEQLCDLWGGDEVQIYECGDCGFGFSHPFAAGTETIYNLIGGGNQHYPSKRFEFTETVKLLSQHGRVDRLLELGAGSGAFLAKVIQANLADHITALEYEDSAVAGLRRLPGVNAVQGDVQELLERSPEPFDVICMFQVLEHMDRLDSVFRALYQLTKSGSEVFIAVPNSMRTRVQEELTGFMDMPPHHIGRWTNESLRLISGRHGFQLVAIRLDHHPAPLELWELAIYRLEQRTRQAKNLAAKVEQIPFRPLRGALKRTMAVWDLAVLSPQLGKIPPGTRLFQLRRD
jgi:SAM-dependent methyltransferase